MAPLVPVVATTAPHRLQVCRVAPRPLQKDHPWQPSLATPTTREQLETMRQLESSTYLAEHYFCYEQSCMTVSRCYTVEYLYQVVDYGGFQRDVVTYAMTHLLDRYLSTRSDISSLLTEQNPYQLISLTCLYMAVKLLEPNNIGIESLVALTNHVYSVQDFQDMESNILDALDWRVAHGPTPLAFVQHLLQLLPDHQKLASALYPHVQYQLELAVSDYKLSCFHSDNHRPSQLAVAAIWNALEAIDVSVFSTHEKQRYQAHVERALGRRMDPELLRRLQSTLRELMLAAYTWCTSSSSSPTSSPSPSTCKSTHKTTTTPDSPSIQNNNKNITNQATDSGNNQGETDAKAEQRDDTAPCTPPRDIKTNVNRSSITSAISVHKEQQQEEEEQNELEKKSGQKTEHASSPSHDSINDVSEVEWFLYAS
ncbi:diatom-specific cyclin [Seminavis robusta]|uniref:Diatom-specific cyclin n=1 Tax=Seminavis robusta TaxID=568900 RepID=A0A9N8EXH4_9STRA|nr:diatom-specific cyclin [Seminavis robusta]|eukprot:Sro2349_g324350.1 diatom-specific cyclin (425) ;mRNA; r:1251-2525